MKITTCRFSVVVVCIAMSLAACSTNPTARSSSLRHGANVERIALGDTMLIVRQTMGADPEVRTKRILPDGRGQEEWGYVTNYEHDVLTVLTFTDRTLTEIRQTPWRGEYDVDTIAAGEDISSPLDQKRAADLAAERQARVDAIGSHLKVGMPGSRVIPILGEPVEVQIMTPGSAPHRYTYRTSAGQKVVITVRDGKVASIDTE